MYSAHVQALFNKKCISCHGTTTAEAGLKLDTWNNVIKGSNYGEALIPFDADNSLMMELVRKLTNGPHPSEAGADTLTTVEANFLARWINEGGRNDNNEVPYQNSTKRLYVCNQSAAMVSVIDTDAKVVIRNIKLTDLGYSTEAKPHDVTVEPDGQYWYVSLIGDGKVVKFDKDNNFVAEADFDAAGLLAMHPTKDLLYVGHTLSIQNVPQTVGAITRSTMSLTPIPLPFTRPHAFVADRAGRYVYFASLVNNIFAVIDTDTNPDEVDNLTNISGGHTLVQMNISPDDREIYITSQFTEQMLILDSSDPSNITTMDSVHVGQHPWHPKYTPDGNYVYVGNNVSNTVSVVNTMTRHADMTIGTGDGSDGLAQPHGLVVSPGGKYVYVTNRNVLELYTPRYDLGDNAKTGTVVVINTSSNSIDKVLELEESLSGATIYED
jgi:YVTN family beta-propeller protein